MKENFLRIAAVNFVKSQSRFFLVLILAGPKLRK